MNRIPALLACLLTAALLAACGGQAIQRKDGSSSVRSFSLKELAKGDVDTVIEIHQQEILGTLRTLTLKLYRRNPSEWRKSGFASADDATAALFKPLEHWQLHPQKDLPWETVLLEPWRADFGGDRVKALMSGLVVMHMTAFNHQTEFYLLTEVDAQKLYNAARNTEAVVWKLSSARNAQGEPVLLSNGFDGSGVANLSFEREFGKLIGIQDTLARIIEDKSNRAIRFGVVNVASMAFLPI
ncbi:MAG: hypothetical protein B7X93_11980 [Hydrogenophilales bacterium 17-61-9]|nr:MAG: hypothetical protein B7Y33_05605 [Hydrogenophilales bacterium 16-62-9]OZA23714.1 MAG: hypothetical protein B7X93_11980 [Hydrogenophilales bacterium 17-61-9]